MNKLTTPPAEEMAGYHGCAFDQYKCNILTGLRLFSASISTVGSLFMIIIIITFKKHHVFSQRPILYLSIVGMINSIAYLMSGGGNGRSLGPGTTCTAQGFLIQFTELSVLVWFMWLTFIIYQSMLHSRPSPLLELPMHVVAWGCPFLLALYPLIYKQYGPSGQWCWIVDSHHTERVLLWYLPLAIGLVVLVGVNIHILYAVNRKLRVWQGLYTPDQEHQKAIMRREASRLWVYPFIYFMFNAFACANRVQDVMSSNKQPIFGLAVLHTMTAPLLGAMSGVYYGLDRDTYSKLTWAHLKTLWGGQRKRRQVQEYPAGRINSLVDDKQLLAASEDNDNDIEIENESESITMSIL